MRRRGIAFRSSPAGAAAVAWCACALAAAGCSSGTSGEREASFHSQRAITAVLQLPATSAQSYRDLLPLTFDMPDDLEAMVTVVSYDEVTAPLVPYREGYVMLSCKHQGSAGWYTLTMPVTDQTANDMGRAVGFPKYVADRIDLTEGAAGAWSGEVVHGGHSVLRVEFTPLAAPVTTALADGDPAFTLVPPGEGPTVYETTIRGSRTATTTSGTASVISEAEERWVGLLSQATSVSASFAETNGDWYLDPSELR
jgi:hypothetical protein